MEAQRIMDFISGCIFAISGNMCGISFYLYLFTEWCRDFKLSDYIKVWKQKSYNIASFNKEF